MKESIVIIIILISIILGNHYTNQYLKVTSDDLINDLKSLKEHVIKAKETLDREEIKKEMDKVEESWSKTSEIWSVIVMHQEIDNIEQALIKSKAMISDGNIEEAIPEIETAIFFVEHVEQNGRVKLKNIL